MRVWLLLVAQPDVPLWDTNITKGKTELQGRNGQGPGGLGPEHPMLALKIGRSVTVGRDLSPQGTCVDRYSLPGARGPDSSYRTPSQCRHTQRWPQRASTCRWQRMSQKAGRCTCLPVGRRTDTQTDTTLENRVGSQPPRGLLSALAAASQEFAHL